MSSTTLLAAAGFSLVSAAVYVFLGVRLGLREVSPEGALPARMFAAWWLGLGSSTVMTGIMTLAGGLGFVNVDLFLVLTYLNVGLICVALCGLLYYLLYLYTGLRNILAPLAVFYLAYFVLLLLFLQYSHASGVDLKDWQVALHYDRQPGGVFLALVIGLLLLPQLLGGLAYLTLYFKARGPTQRYRIALVSLAILVWFGSPLLGLGAGVSNNVSWQLLTRFVSLAAAITILLAYYPPGWVQRKWGIVSIRAQPVKGGAEAAR